jgi:hypothetical protein
VSFPRPPHPFVGRAGELRTLVAACRAGVNRRLALIGPGGGGKSVLAAAIGYKLRADYPGGLEWFRVGGWDHRTLLDMLAIRMRVPLGGFQRRDLRMPALRRAFGLRGRMFIVLDNHEDDRAMARFLTAVEDLDVSWVLTARRCLLSGVSVFPVVPPLVTAGRSPFRAVAALTALLRWNPLALDVSNALVESGAITAAALGAWLVRRRVARVSVVAHEDDVPELRLLLRWVWPQLGRVGRAMLVTLAHLQGDHVDGESLASLARAGRGAGRALAQLRRWHLVQEPLPGRYALHATLKYAVIARTTFDQRRAVAHFVDLLERRPERLDVEQTHLFAAMDYAHSTSDTGLALRLDRLLCDLGLT